MSMQMPTGEPEGTNTPETGRTDADEMVLRWSATIGLGLAVLVVLALSGGTLDVTRGGLSIAVNPPA